ncbi:hypothetical protein C8Q79DRAFT_1014160 [Trametes meyenii]|nr:hypothetical protein C8Q79DRAFT_1014160 [Trametes meyenii]
MVTVTVIVSAAIGKSLASVKAHKIAPMATKVKSSISKLASSHKASIAAAGNSLLRRHSRRDRKRAPRKSLPWTLDPLPEDACTPLLAEVQGELAKMFPDSDKESEHSHPESDASTLVGSHEAQAFPCALAGSSSYDKAKIVGVVECLVGDTTFDPESPDELLLPREDMYAQEIALYKIRVVPQVASPPEDYFSKGLEPLPGYDA